MTTINNLPLCITLGDPLGIGPEITVRTLDFLQKKKNNISFIVIGSNKAFHKACDNLNINKNFKYIKEFIDYDETIEFLSKPSVVGGSISYKSICKAAELYKNKMVKAIVTAPISKESLHLAGHKFDGHTGLLGSLFHVEEPYLMLANKNFSTLHVTCHKSLKEAIKLITKEKIVEVVNIGYKHMLKVKKTEPRIAVCGLNPHAGENGIFGTEEINEIIPAVEFLKTKGLNIVGPISPDIIFREAVKKKFDLVIANYHDQGHIPVKLLYFDQSVNVTLGVPFIRTSVDHGTAFDIAYKNRASAKNMLNAIFYALKMSNIR